MPHTFKLFKFFKFFELFELFKRFNRVRWPPGWQQDSGVFPLPVPGSGYPLGVVWRRSGVRAGRANRSATYLETNSGNCAPTTSGNPHKSRQV